MSAGGWLARLALGGAPYDGRVFGLAPAVHTLVCLGTPNKSLEQYPLGRASEAWCAALQLPPGVQTSLGYANLRYPDAASLAPTQVACVCGSAVCGESVGLWRGLVARAPHRTRSWPDALPAAACRAAPPPGRALTAADARQVLTGQLSLPALRDAWLVATGYIANCGDAAVDGDGVTPLACAMLPGAAELVLPGVWHNRAPGRRWYGSDDVVEQWAQLLP